MRDVVEQLRVHFWMILHHRWVGLSGALLLTAVGWAVIEILPSQYEVETKVYLDTQSVLKPLLQGLAVDNTVREQSAQIMRRTLISRPNLEQVLRETDMELKARAPEEREKLIQKTQESIKVSSVEIPGSRQSKDDSNIYLISYTNEDPKLAKRVVESLLNIFVERVLGTSRKDTSQAQQFLEEQIKDYAGKLEVAEDKFKQFKIEHAGMMSEEGKTYFSRMQDLDTRLSEARLALREAEDRSAELRKQIQAMVDVTQASAGTDVVVPPTPLEERIQAMEKRLDELLLQYTEQHPDVVSTRRALAELHEEKKKEDATAAKGGAKQKDLTNVKAYQDLKVLLGQAEGEAAALRARVQEYEKKVADLKPLVDTIPKVEAEASKLDRDYKIIKATYEQLVQRRESARISQGAQETADESQFRVVEPPRLPTLPSSPDRLTLATVVLVAGLGAGGLLAWLFAQIKPTFYSKKQLVDLVSLPVLGSVMMEWTPGEIAKRRAGIVVFGVCLLGLLSAYGVLMWHFGLDVKPWLDAAKALQQKVL